MCPENARSLAAHLVNNADVAECAEGQPRAGIIGVRQLPTITLRGQRFFIDERQVKAVVAQDPVPPEIVALMHDVLGVDGVDVGGVTVWQVPESGATESEPPPPAQVITTAP